MMMILLFCCCFYNARFDQLPEREDCLFLAGLEHDVFPMGNDCPVSDPQDATDFIVAHPVPDHFGNFPLLDCEF